MVDLLSTSYSNIYGASIVTAVPTTLIISSPSCMTRDVIGF